MKRKIKLSDEIYSELFNDALSVLQAEARRLARNAIKRKGVKPTEALVEQLLESPEGTRYYKRATANLKAKGK